MPKQKPHILLLSVGLVLLFGFTACVMAKTYIAYSKQLNRMAVIQTAFENMADHTVRLSQCKGLEDTQEHV